MFCYYFLHQEKEMGPSFNKRNPNVKRFSVLGLKVRFVHILFLPRRKTKRLTNMKSNECH